MFKKDRSLIGLLISQFFGAFNDNAWKLMVFTLATRALSFGQSAEEAELSSQFQATLSLLVFLVPMMLFSIPAGSLADRFSKRSVIIWTKALEVLVMAGAAITLYFAPLNIVLPYILLAGMGMQSGLFSPSKYGILPEIVQPNALGRSNGLIEMWTMVAIIAGTGLGPVLLAADKGGTVAKYTWLGALWLFALAIIGFIASFAIPKVPVMGKTNSVTDAMRRAWGLIRRDQALGLAILGSIFYWYITSLIGQNVLVYAKSLVIELERGEIWQGIPPASYGIGIALGALFAGRYSSERVELGLIPVGAVGFSITSVLLGVLQPDMIGTVLVLIAGGIFAGMVIVPLHAIIQSRAPERRRGAIIACGNLLDISGMILGSFTAMGMALLGWNMKAMLIWSAIIVIAATVWAIKTLPRALIRFCFILLTRTVYTLRMRGLENLPKEGPAVLVSNHISFVDALLVMAAVDRPVHFIMSEYYFSKWWMRPIFKLLGCLPVATNSSPRTLIESLKSAGKYLDQGEILCIFPEGQISHTGMLQPFRRGIEVILRGRDCPIVPLYLDGVWGSVFSYKGGRFVFKMPRNFTIQTTVTFGAPMVANSTIAQIREAIKALENNAWDARKEDQKPMPLRFIWEARKHPFKLAAVDAVSGKVSSIKLLAGAVALARSMKTQWADQEFVGLMLPTSVGAVLANLSATLAGKGVVNINFTSGREGVASCVHQAGLKQVITTRGLLTKIENPLPKDVECLYLEDLMIALTPWQKWAALGMAFFADPYNLQRTCGMTREFSPDDPLNIIFTSGSTGEPKGVVLSHFNISSNVESVGQVLPSMLKRHRLLNALPLFHSFGTMMMWLGLTHGHPLVLQPNPLDYGAVGELVWKHKATLMMTTPTFLRGYMKRVNPGQFGTLKAILTGAEKLNEQLALQFEKEFGIRPVEGYGATECSPAIATCTMTVRDQGICQIGAILGSVGQPLPGVVVKIVHPETFEDLPIGESGLLLVKGPNVMCGYLNRPDLTEKVIKDGWYITGDIANLDDDGFIMITDRLSRFSKIGGEMVPHMRVEEALHQAAQSQEQLFAVTAVPCPDKGERLAVLHTYQADRIGGLLTRLSQLGLPNLYLPRLDHFIQVETLPFLGTGKLDLRAAREIAKSRL
jgi:acyl-[acyl-carrier-protein]-phospholipid O-acyltransferase/long-chain-fatty-acid--[acyl-carrier-protein] ligase